MSSSALEIVEVGPRDGLQNEALALEPEVRAEFIRRLEACGARRLEAVSFVHPRLVPQMAGAEDVMAALSPDPSRTRIGLVLNEKGLERALAAGVDEVNISVSATESFGLKNQGLGLAAQRQMLADFAARGDFQPSQASVTLSCVFGCPFEGEVDEAGVLSLVADIAALGYGEIALADTIGAGDPWRVRRLSEQSLSRMGDARLRLHFHDTRGTGLANAFAGYEAGARVLDASCGGFGGCPFAPGASGNIATEDLVFMFERAGIETGYDLGGLLETAAFIGAHLAKSPPSRLSRARPFPG